MACLWFLAKCLKHHASKLAGQDTTTAICIEIRIPTFITTRTHRKAEGTCKLDKAHFQEPEWYFIVVKGFFSGKVTEKL